jgi:hypothetical protein
LLKDRNTRGEAVAERDGEPTRDCDREAVAVTLKPRVGDRDGDAARVAEFDAERDREADVVTLKLPRVGDCDGDAARDRDRDGDAARDRDGDGDARDAERERERDGDRDCDCALSSAGSSASSSSSSSRRACRAMSRPSLASDVCGGGGEKRNVIFLTRRGRFCMCSISRSSPSHAQR